MDDWYSVSLGDGMTAGTPSGEIQAVFGKLFPEGAVPSDTAVFTRLESEGRLHCEMFAYFSPAAKAVAKAFDARPCRKPARAGLGLLAGTEDAWSALFDAPDESSPF